MDIKWDGVKRAQTLQKDELALRQQLASAAKSYKWHDVLALLSKRPDIVNTTRPDGTALYAPLHQAAHGGAPLEVVEKMLELGAWRTLRNARGERAVEVAWTHKHVHLLAALRPRYKHQVPSSVMIRLQKNFHKVIRGRVEKLVEEHNLRLPELEPLLELEEPRMWFEVPGMYGGFHYWLEPNSVNTKLISESWCRVVEGSEERHEITWSGSKLVKNGFYSN